MAKVNTWASGGITCTMPRKSNTGLSTQLWVLGKKNNDCITIETEGWINAHRLIFNTLNRAEHEDLKADIQPITIRVNEKNIIGEGSMQRAFKAEVKTICSDGSAIITNHVAKIQYHEKYQTIAHHATDALMYEASGLLLSKFKCLISESSRVEHQYKKIANTLQVSYVLHPHSFTNPADFSMGPLATTPTDSPETPNTSESSASNDEETVMEQLTRTRKRGNASVPVTRRTRKGGLDSASERSEPLPPSSKAAQNKKIKAELHEDPPESKVSEKSLRSRTASGKVPSTIKEENATLDQEKHEQDLEANAKPSNNESPGANVSTRGADESHSALHSPNSNKRSLLENDHSVDGSHVGTPNSAWMTDGNSTANQTPNSAKVPLFPADASSAGPRAGSSSTTSDPTSFRRRMLKTHSSVQSNPISSIFRDPVKESEAPGYTSIIKRPMDLRTLAKKLRDGKVITTEEYCRDLMLMLANAVMFNHEESEVTKHAKELMVECDRLVSIFMRGSRY
ncbi:hypothetical protein, variant [Puccinia striiformis f. sp. tritici PST-78]|uniref:Bromo domain-containing protein n=1 Tax=Puccinia striiformis f. sp. tritici PST-78 TaxID=1165861 RepID=A0A0L0VMI8_9BASI|nr:hypothetical protein, variant [Puccinia striiformis f. sp. tritici PST-78]